MISFEIEKVLIFFHHVYISEFSVRDRYLYRREKRIELYLNVNHDDDNREKVFVSLKVKIGSLKWFVFFE